MELGSSSLKPMSETTVQRKNTSSRPVPRKVKVMTKVAREDVKTLTTASKVTITEPQNDADAGTKPQPLTVEVKPQPSVETVYKPVLTVVHENVGSQAEVSVIASAVDEAGNKPQTDDMPPLEQPGEQGLSFKSFKRDLKKLLDSPVRENPQPRQARPGQIKNNTVIQRESQKFIAPSGEKTKITKAAEMEGIRISSLMRRRRFFNNESPIDNDSLEVGMASASGTMVYTSVTATVQVLSLIALLNFAKARFQGAVINVRKTTKSWKAILPENRVNKRPSPLERKYHDLWTGSRIN